MLLYCLDVSFVNSDSKNVRFDIRVIMPQILLISRTNVLPVLPATLRNFQAVVQYLLAFDQFSTKSLELLTVCKCNQVIRFAVDVDIDEKGLFFLDSSYKD